MKFTLKKSFLVVLVLSLFSIVGCGGSSDSDSAAGNVTVTMKASALAARVDLASLEREFPAGFLTRALRNESRRLVTRTDASQGTAVTVNTGACTTMAGISYCECTVVNSAHGSTLINATGYCADPVEVAGGISSVSLFRTGRIPARILGGGMELSTNQTGALDVQAFDLRDTAQLTGEDNLQDSNATTNWEGAQVYFSHVDVKVPPVVISSVTTYYTIRYVFYSQPIVDEAVVQACGIDAPGLATIEANSDFLAGLTFKRNDVLICSKTADTACEDSDFKFLDTSGAGSLVATRPTTEGNVYKTSITDDDELDCTAPEGGVGGADMNLGGMWMIGELAEGFNLTAELGKTKSYTLTSAAGTVTTGTKVTATLDFDVSNMIFINTGASVALATWLDGSSLSTIGQSVQFLPIYVRNQLDGVYEGSSYTVRDSALPVTATIAVQ